jgi:signal transduction histidine kinase/CheY-like chemotaxis protein
LNLIQNKTNCIELLNRISDAVLIFNKKHQLIFANKLSCRLFNLNKDSREQLLEEIVPVEIVENILNLQQHYDNNSFELFLNLNDFKWIEYTISVDEDEITLIIKDITNKKHESIKQDKHQQLQLLADAANHLFFKNDPKEILDSLFMELSKFLDLDVYFNYMFVESEKKLRLMNFHGISDDIAKEIEWLEFGQAVCGTVARDKHRIIAEDIDKSNDSKVELVKGFGIKAYACHPLIAYGRMIGTLSFGSSKRSTFSNEELDLIFTICNQLAITFERSFLIEELKKKKDEAEKASKAKSDFLSMISHELRTPLNSILGFTQIVSCDPKNPINEKQKKNLGKVEKAGQHLLSLINEIIDLVKIDSIASTLKLEPIKFVPLIQDCGAIISSELIKKEIKLTVEMNGLDDVAINVDERRFRQVLLNILSNAIKFTKRYEEIKLVSEVDSNYVKVSVIDNGIGIPEAELNRILEPFYRIYHPEFNIEGTGIGLTLVKQYVDQMYGKLEVKSELGKGSSFSILFPLYKDTNLSNPFVDKPRLIGNLDTLNKASLSGKILYIDDNTENQDLMREFIEDYPNLRLLVASDGKIGLKKAVEEKPDLILLDLHLPLLNGFEVMNNLKDNLKTNLIPVICISADAMNSSIEIASKLGFKDYLTKPIDFVRMMNVIHRELDRKEN